MTEAISFQDTIARLNHVSSKHALLGNGFSRACRNDIFAYEKLFEQADFSRLSACARQAFAALGTTDFEMVMEALKRAAILLRLYESTHSSVADVFDQDANGLREVLVSAIANSHPARPGDISNEQYGSCKMFLSHFQDIYTLNYDLLLYWALMQDQVEPVIPCDDGFRQPDYGVADWVTWDSSAHGQSVHYLHGGLHIFEAGPEIQKYTWCNTGLPLIDQIRAALQAEKYPLFVAEGTASQKMSRIIRSSFLGRAYRAFENIGGAVIAYGLSFGDSDGHVVRAMTRNKVRHLAVSLYGSPDSETNQALVAKVEGIRLERASQGARRTLEVIYFDATTARVWG
jgi:hypothetical protein